MADPTVTEPSPKRYEYIWRNKFIGDSTASSIAALIEDLETAVSILKEMQQAGVEMEEQEGVDDDYYMLITTDQKVAEKFGFDEIPDFEDFEEE